jgi:hypothetical protein
MTHSNLSKIKPKLRTTGQVSGNFGRPKSKAGSTLNDLGGSGNIGASQDEYLSRLYSAFDSTTNKQLRQFAFIEIRKILIQRNLWED